MSAPPPPLDDPSISNPLECPPLRWGLIGCGRVSHDFTQALKHLPNASVVACAARSVDDAKEFAEKHGIARYYGGYDELLDDANVDIVYVGNIHIYRRSIGEKCLLANKHALLEKPFTCTAEDARYLVNLARERNLFFMEGMWTRFFPAVEMARRIVFQEKKLGEVVSVFSDFHFNAADSDPYPTSFLYNHALGGGASLLVAPYPIAFATLFFNGRMPESVKVVGQVDKGTGVDLQAAMVVSFSPTSDLAPALDDNQVDENTPKLPGAGVATLSFGMMAESIEETMVLGTKGRLTIKSPSHCPTRLTVSLKAAGRGQTAEELEYNFSLPEDTDEITKAGGYFYPNSAGFCYEAAAVARCIAAGKTEAPQYTLQDTLVNMALVDEVRSQLGVKRTGESC
ncbi:oxidoreductase [Fragilaria crotonensis]|nr:oxidoreductase [Fragilaria crotonensis]